MHQTSVRFGEETWRQLTALADREGVPVAQLIREGTVAHLATLGERQRTVEVESELAALRERVARLERRLDLR